MQSAEQQKCQPHTGLHRNQQCQQRPGSDNCRQPDQGDLRRQKLCCHRSTLCPALCFQLWTPELLSHHCFDHAATHTLSVLGLVNSVLNLLKAPIVYLNKAATGFYTLIAKPRLLVTEYTRFFVREDTYTCYFINTDKTITFLVTELIFYSFISLVNITIGSNVSALTLGCLRCENTEKQVSLYSWVCRNQRQDSAKTQTHTS